MAFVRTSIREFSLSNPLYVGANVTFFTVDSNGVKTTTKATLYAAQTGTATLLNPQVLDSTGKFPAPVYADVVTIGSVAGALVAPDHDTGVIRPSLDDSQVARAQNAADRAGGMAAIAAVAAEEAATDAAAAAVSAAAAGSYDIPFIAGFIPIAGNENVQVATYGETVIARAGSFTGESGYADTAPTGAAGILDIEKNGTTIYATKPQFNISTQTLTAGTLKTDGTEDFIAGDRITFKVTQIGSTVVGQGFRFTVKANLA